VGVKPLSTEVSLEEASVPGLAPPPRPGDAVEELHELLATTGHGRPPESLDSLSLDPVSLSLEAESVEVLPLDEVPYAPPISVADIPIRDDVGSGTWDEDIEISDPEGDFGQFLDWLETGVQPPVIQDTGEVSAFDEAPVSDREEAAPPEGPTSEESDEPAPADEAPEAVAETEEAVAETAEAVAETAEAVAETAEAVAETAEVVAETEEARAEPESEEEVARTMEDTSDVGLAVTEEALPAEESLAELSGADAEEGSPTEEALPAEEALADLSMSDPTSGAPAAAAPDQSIGLPLFDEGPEETEELPPLTDEGPAETEELAPLTDEGPAETEELEPVIGSDALADFPSSYEVQPTGQEPPIADSEFDIPVEAPERTHAETEPSLEPPSITIDEPTLRNDAEDLDEPTEPASLEDLLEAAASVSFDAIGRDAPAAERDDGDEDTEYVTSRFDREGPWVAPLSDEVLPWPLAVVGLTEVLPGEWSPPAGHSLSGPMPAGTGTHEEELELDLAPELELDVDDLADAELEGAAAEPDPAADGSGAGPIDAPVDPERVAAQPGSLDTPVSADVAADSVAASEEREDWLRGMDNEPEVSVGYDVEIIPSVTMDEPGPRDPDLPTQLTSKVELERALASLEEGDPEAEPVVSGDLPTRRVDASSEPDADQTRRVPVDEPPTLVERPEVIDRAAPDLDDDDDDELVTEMRTVEELEAALAAAGLGPSAPEPEPEPEPPEEPADAPEQVVDEPSDRAEPPGEGASEGAEEPDAATTEDASDPEPVEADLAAGPAQADGLAAVVTVEPALDDDDDADDLSLDDLEVDDLELDELELDPSQADIEGPASDEPSVEAEAPAARPATPAPSLTVAAVVSTLRALRQEKGAPRPRTVWLELGDPDGAPASTGEPALWLQVDDPAAAPEVTEDQTPPRIELDDSEPGLTSLTLEGTDDELASRVAEVVAADGAVRVELDLGRAPPERREATQGVAVAPAEPIRSWQGKPVPDVDPATDLVALARDGGDAPADAPAAAPESPSRGDDWLDPVARDGDPDEEAPMSPYYIDTQPVQVPQEVRQVARATIGKPKPGKPRKRKRRKRKK